MKQTMKDIKAYEKYEDTKRIEERKFDIGVRNIELSEKQIEAVKAINDNNVCIITGGPGTGKTTIVNAIVKLFINW